MNKNKSLKHLFSRIIIPNTPMNRILSDYEKIKYIKNDNKLYSSFSKKKSNLIGAEQYMFQDNLTSPNTISNKKQSKIMKYNSFKIKTRLKNNRINLFHKKNKYSTSNTTQTPSIPPILSDLKRRNKTLTNSFRNRYYPLNIKKKLKKEKDGLSSYIHNSNNWDNNYKNLNENNDYNSILYLKKDKNRNNICINSNMKKIIKNAIVDNNIDLMKEIRFQTVNNFNNKYKLKFRAKNSKMCDKINNVFSMLKLYKYEEEKKIDAIKTLTNERPKKIFKRKNDQQILFNQKDFDKNFSLIQKDFNINKKLKDNKKFVSIHTLALLKK